MCRACRSLASPGSEAAPSTTMATLRFRSKMILSQKVCAGRIRTNVPTPGYNIQSLFRILPQHTVALRCAKSLELPQNGFLRGNQDSPPSSAGLDSALVYRICPLCTGVFGPFSARDATSINEGGRECRGENSAVAAGDLEPTAAEPSGTIRYLRAARRSPRRWQVSARRGQAPAALPMRWRRR